MTAIQTDGRRMASWSERGATATIFLTLGILVGAWAAALPGLKIKLDLSTWGLSVALFSVSIGSVLSSVSAGFILPRFGTGRSTGYAALALVVVFALTPFAASLLQFVAAGFAVGLAIGLLDVAVNGHAGDIEHRWGGPIMSSFHGAFSVGGLVGSALGGLIAWTGAGVETQIWVPVVLAAVCDIAVLPSLGSGQAAQVSGGGGPAWPSRTMVGLCVVVLFCFIIEGAMADWSAVYLSSVTGSSLALAAAGYAAFSLTMAAGRLAGDAAMGRFGPRLLVGAGGFLAALGLAIAVAFAEPVVAVVGFALVGLGAANVVPAVFSAAARAGRSPATGVAFVTAVGYAGFLSGPPLIGSIAALAGLRVAITCLVAAAVLSAITGLVVFARRTAADT